MKPLNKINCLVYHPNGVCNCNMEYFNLLEHEENQGQWNTEAHAVPKPKKVTDKQKLEIKLAKMKAKQQQTIEKLKEKTNKRVKKATQIPMTKLKESTQREVNKYVRERDKGLPCVSCGKLRGDRDAGHYWSLGGHSALRYNLDNLAAQCRNCNYWKSGNLGEYRIELIKRIGEQRVQLLDDHRFDKHKFTREELEAIRVDIKQKTEMLKNERYVLNGFIE